MKSHWYMYLPTSSLSFFLVHRAKRSRHANDHAGYLRCETGEASRAAALVSRARALPWNTKYEEKERLIAVYICTCTNLHSLVCMVYLSWASESNFVNFHVFCNCHSCCWSISWYQVYNTWWKTSLENTQTKKYNCKPLTLITCLLDLELIRKVDIMKHRKDGAKIKNVPLIYMYMYTARSNNYSFPLIPSRENIWTFQWYTKQSTNDVGTTVKFRK